MKYGRSSIFFLIGIICLAGGLATGRPLWFRMAYLVGTLLIASFLWAWVNIRWTRITRATRTRHNQVGQPFDERLTVQNTAWLPKLWLEVRDFSTLPGHHLSQVVNGLAPKKSFSWQAQTISRLRGRYRLGPLQLRSSDPFGLFTLERDIEASSHIVVYPWVFDIHQFHLPQGMLSGGDALRRRTFHVTTNASGVRDYAPGDSFGRIHWASTARRDRLIVKEFELDPQTDMWIVPDLSADNHIKTPPTYYETNYASAVLPALTEEYTISITASVTRFFLQQDRAVGLLAYGQSEEIVQPERGERQLNHLLERLAVLRAVGSTNLINTLLTESHRFQRGSTLIVVTPLTDERWVPAARELLRRGIKIVTILINPASFGGQNSAENLHALLQTQNLMAYLINLGDNLTEKLDGGKRSFVKFN